MTSFIIPGSIRSKKNSKRIVRAGKYPVAAIPGKECAIYSALVHYKLKDN